MAAAIGFISFWVVLGVAVFLVAIGGGPRGARETVLHSQTRGGRRTVGVLLAAAFLGFGVAIPAIVIAGNKDKDTAGPRDIKLTAAEEHGRELFGQTCNQCHTLAAAHTAGKVGPDLDELRPPKALVLDAIENGRVRGAGTMPAALLEGRDASDVAAFVARVAGK